jgi:ligand-binding SRPBCC domain-containing protein
MECFGCRTPSILTRKHDVHHHLEAVLELPLPIDTVFAFFSDAANLQRITPPELHFQIVTPLPITMEVGALLVYRLGLFGVPIRWTTRIAEWDPPHRFVDEQLSGPYSTWVHTHTFEKTPAGTLIRDRVVYGLPLWPFGEVAYPMVRRQLDRIFSYRQQVVREALLGVTE